MKEWGGYCFAFNFVFNLSWAFFTNNTSNYIKLVLPALLLVIIVKKVGI